MCGTLHLQSHKKLFHLFVTLPQILHTEEHHCESIVFSWCRGVWKDTVAQT